MTTDIFHLQPAQSKSFVYNALSADPVGLEESYELGRELFVTRLSLLKALSVSIRAVTAMTAEWRERMAQDSQRSGCFAAAVEGGWTRKVSRESIEAHLDELDRKANELAVLRATVLPQSRVNEEQAFEALLASMIPFEEIQFAGLKIASHEVKELCAGFDSAVDQVSRHLGVLKNAVRPVLQVMMSEGRDLEQVVGAELATSLLNANAQAQRYDLTLGSACSWQADVDRAKAKCEEIAGRFVRGNEGLVRKYVARFQHIEHGEAYLMGMEALLRAVYRFHFESGNLYTTVAMVWLKSRLSIANRSKATTKTLPVQAPSRLVKAAFNVRRLTDAGMSFERACSELGIDDAVRCRLTQVMQLRRRQSFDDQMSYDGGEPGEVIPSDYKVIDHGAVDEQLKQFVTSNLGEKNAELVMRFFGLAGERVMLRELADELGVSQERISKRIRESVASLAKTAGSGTEAVRELALVEAMSNAA